jgi:hypothetical protein
MFPSAIITKKSAKVLQDKQSFFIKKKGGRNGVPSVRDFYRKDTTMPWRGGK